MEWIYIAVAIIVVILTVIGGYFAYSYKKLVNSLLESKERQIEQLTADLAVLQDQLSKTRGEERKTITGLKIDLGAMAKTFELTEAGREQDRAEKEELRNQVQELIADNNQLREFIGLRTTKDWHIELMQMMGEVFNLEDIKNLCFDLRVNFHDLGGESTNQEGKIRELIHFMMRHGRIHELISECLKRRPNVNWPIL